VEKVINSYRDLEVWKKAMELVTDVYKVTQTFVKEELYGLTSQLRRAAVSVPANIAEGWGRGTNKQLGTQIDPLIPIGSSLFAIG